MLRIVTKSYIFNSEARMQAAEGAAAASKCKFRIQGVQLPSQPGHIVVHACTQKARRNVLLKSRAHDTRVRVCGCAFVQCIAPSGVHVHVHVHAKRLRKCVCSSGYHW